MVFYPLFLVGFLITWNFLNHDNFFEPFVSVPERLNDACFFVFSNFVAAELQAFEVSWFVDYCFWRLVDFGVEVMFNVDSVLDKVEISDFAQAVISVDDH